MEVLKLTADDIIGFFGPAPAGPNCIAYFSAPVVQAKIVIQEHFEVGEGLRLIQDEKMWALLRPGPYVCAEWDFGGIPPYLLRIPDIKVRCMDPRYMEAAERYLEQMASLVKPLLVSNGGPILMIQIENEYGSYGNDKNYLEQLRKIWIRNGIDGPFFTGDGPTPYMLEAGNIDGAAIGLDPGYNAKAFAQAALRNPNVPAFSSETYPGWLTHWGEKWAITSLLQVISIEVGLLLPVRSPLQYAKS